MFMNNLNMGPEAFGVPILFITIFTFELFTKVFDWKKKKKGSN